MTYQSIDSPKTFSENVPLVVTDDDLHADFVNIIYKRLINNDALIKSVQDVHIAASNNPHAVTKTQVGLENVQNYSVANQAEAEAGSLATRYMTPQRTSQAIAALSPVKSVASRTGIVTLAKGDVGLSNVDNNKQMPISGSTFTGRATAHSPDTGYTTFMIRNIRFGTSDPSDAVGNNGDVFFVY